jgi:hypothetical protein
MSALSEKANTTVENLAFLMALATWVFSRSSKRLQIVSSMVSAVTVLKAPMASDPNYGSLVMLNKRSWKFIPESFPQRPRH